MSDIPKGYLKRKGKTIPFGYKESDIEGYFKPIPKQLKVLKKYIEDIQNQKYSLRQASVLIEGETGRKISHVSLKNYIDKGVSITKRRKKILKDKEKQLKADKLKLKKKEETLKKEQQVIDKVTNSSNSNVLTEDEIEATTDSIQETIKNSKVIFHANEGPQTDFLAASEKDVLYGGAAGGGKSYAMLVDPLRYAHKKAHRALILRRSMPELREMIDKSRELYPQAFPGAKFREVEKLWNFPSGAKIEFGFLERDADVYRYQGQAYSWIGFDEITHLPTEFSWNYLASRLRTTDPSIKTYLRCTANPGGAGASWVKKRYIEPYESNKSFLGTDGLTRKFIPAKLVDNPYLAKDGVYEQMLKSLPPIQRRQ